MQDLRTISSYNKHDIVRADPGMMGTTYFRTQNKINLFVGQVVMLFTSSSMIVEAE